MRRPILVISALANRRLVLLETPEKATAGRCMTGADLVRSADVGPAEQQEEPTERWIDGSVQPLPWLQAKMNGR